MKTTLAAIAASTLVLATPVHADATITARADCLGFQLQVANPDRALVIIGVGSDPPRGGDDPDLSFDIHITDTMRAEGGYWATVDVGPDRQFSQYVDCLPTPAVSIPAVEVVPWADLLLAPPW